MKSYFFEYIRRPVSLFVFFNVLIFFETNLIKSGESYLEELQIDTSTKSSENDSGLPTNPFEIVEMIRRANSLNDATNPSDAIDDALKSFSIIEKKEKL